VRDPGLFVPELEAGALDPVLAPALVDELLLLLLLLLLPQALMLAAATAATTTQASDFFKLGTKTSPL
jgi:hypothetical protein